MSKLISSLSYIKARVDVGLTIWDCLSELMLTVIKEKKISDVSAERFCSEFKSVYDISIPIHPMNTIIGRIKRKGFIDDGIGKWVLNWRKINETNIMVATSNEFSDVLSALNFFLKDRYQIEKSIDETEKLLIGYLNCYDGDIYYSLETKTLLPDIPYSEKDSFLVNKFIEHIITSDSQLLNKFEDIVLANIHLNSVFFCDSTRSLKMNRVFVYLDTRVVLRLTGIEGEFRKQEYQKLLDILHTSNCNLRIFDVHHDEIEKIFDDCVKSLENPNTYNAKYASKALRYFVENNYTVSDVLICRAQLDEIKKKYKIGVDVHNYETTDDQYQVSELELTNYISGIYSQNGNHFENGITPEKIKNDVKAISAIYRKRKNFRANSLENISAILVSTNRSLSRAVRAYNVKHDTTQKYNECVTDTFWGTAIWLNTAYSDTTYFQKKIIADSIATIQINPKLKAKFIANIEAKRAQGDISDNEFYVLREYDKVNTLLQDATLNDDEEFNDSLPEEIYEQLKADISRPLQEQIDKQASEKKLQEKSILSLSERLIRQQEKIEQISKYCAIISMIIFGLIVNIPSFVLCFTDYIPDIKLKVGLRLVSLIIGILLSIDGFSRKVFGNKIYQLVRSRLKKLLELE